MSKSARVHTTPSAGMCWHEHGGCPDSLPWGTTTNLCVAFMKKRDRTGIDAAYLDELGEITVDANGEDEQLRVARSTRWRLSKW